jgi:molybdate transport system ATP-binding protein
MSPDFNEIDPNRLAAVLYRPEDDVDALLADFANDRLRRGERIGGIVQINLKDESGRPSGMHALDLMSGRRISICQPLGSGAMACKLDPGGLAEAAFAVTRAITENVDLIVINKFSKQEAAGRGLRSELAEAIVAGVPVLTAVPEKCLGAWTEFTGDRGTMLLCARYVIGGWWQDLSSRMARMRNAVHITPDRAAATLRSSHPTT